MISEHLFRERRTENTPGNKASTTPKIQKNATGPSAILKASNVPKIPGQKDPLKVAKDIKQQIEDLTKYANTTAEVIDAIEENLPENETRLNMQRSNTVAKLDQFKEKLIRVLNDRNPQLKRRAPRVSEAVAFNMSETTELALCEPEMFDHMYVEEKVPLEDEAIQVIQVRRPLKVDGDVVEFHVPLEEVVVAAPVVVEEPVREVRDVSNASVQVTEQKVQVQLDDVAVAVVKYHARAYHYVVSLTLAHTLVDGVPHSEVSPTEITLHHTYILVFFKYSVVNRQVGI